MYLYADDLINSGLITLVCTRGRLLELWEDLGARDRRVGREKGRKD